VRKTARKKRMDEPLFKKAARRAWVEKYRWEGSP
jgi:hypothetical protein